MECKILAVSFPFCEGKGDIMYLKVSVVFFLKVYDKVVLKELSKV